MVMSAHRSSNATRTYTGMSVERKVKKLMHVCNMMQCDMQHVARQQWSLMNMVHVPLRFTRLRFDGMISTSYPSQPYAATSCLQHCDAWQGA
jgi:hypothetical protein